MEKMLNFAFIGCGNVSRFHADVIHALNHKISCVAARKSSFHIDKFSKDYKVSYKYDDYREMLDSQSPDAIVVAVSWDQTEKILEDVLKRKIPCLVEKPVALTSDKIKNIISISQEYNQAVLVGYNRRFYDFIPLLKEAIEAKELYSIELNFPEAVESMVKKYSLRILDYILVYISSHWLDLLLYLVGDLEIKWMHRNINENSRPSGSYNGMLFSLKHNVPVHLQSNFNSPSQTSITFNFKDEVYKLCPIEMLSIYKGMDIIEPNESIKIRRYVPKLKDTHGVNTNYKPGFYRQMENFIETCVKKKKMNEIGCTLENAFRVTQLCEQIKGL